MLKKTLSVTLFSIYKRHCYQHRFLQFSTPPAPVGFASFKVVLVLNNANPNGHVLQYRIINDRTVKNGV